MEIVITPWTVPLGAVHCGKVDERTVTQCNDWLERYCRPDIISITASSHLSVVRQVRTECDSTAPDETEPYWTQFNVQFRNVARRFSCAWLADLCSIRVSLSAESSEKLVCVRWLYLWRSRQQSTSVDWASWNRRQTVARRSLSWPHRYGQRWVLHKQCRVAPPGGEFYYHSCWYEQFCNFAIMTMAVIETVITHQFIASRQSDNMLRITNI